MEVKFDYTDIPTCERFSESNKFVKGLMGPFGSGKSSTCVWEIIQRSLLQQPGPDGIARTRWAAVRNTYPQLNDTTMNTFHYWFPPAKFGKYRDQRHEYTITRFPGVEIEILYRALDRPDQVDNLLSLELTGAWLNEAREIPEAIFDAIQGRIGRYPAMNDGGPTWNGLIMDTNPPDTDSWWFRLFEESIDDSRTCTRKLADKETICGKQSVRVFNKGTFDETSYCEEHNKYVLFKQPSGLSPQAENTTHLKEDYYEDLSTGKKAEFVKVYVHGDYGFVIDGTPVYPEYNDTIHCETYEVIPELEIRRGHDFGLTPATTFSQMHPSGQWRVFDEFIGKNIGADRFGDELTQYCNQTYPGMKFVDTGDPAGDARSQADEKTCFEIFRAKGISIIAGDQDPGMRVECVKRPLNRMVDGRPGFLLHPRCKQLRKGFKGGYYYRKLQNKSGTISEKPEKNELSHPHDALQYDATRLFSYELRTPVSEERKRYDDKKRRRRRSWMAA